MKNTFTVAIVLGILMFTFLFTSNAASKPTYGFDEDPPAPGHIQLNGVKLKAFEPSFLNPVIPANKPQTFMVEVEANTGEQLESIHIHPLSYPEARKKKNCYAALGADKICRHSIKVKFPKPKPDSGGGYWQWWLAVITTESGKQSQVMWVVKVPEGALIHNGSFHLTPTNDHEIQVEVGKYKQFTARWIDSPVNTIDFSATGQPSSVPKRTIKRITSATENLVGDVTELSHSVKYKWHKSGVYTVKVHAKYLATNYTEEVYSVTSPGFSNPETWMVRVVSTAEVAITQKTPGNQNVHLLANESKQFTIGATSSENIKSITFSAPGAKGNDQRQKSWRLGKKKRNYSTTYIWEQPGTYTVTASVTTKMGATDSTAWTVNVGNFPQQDFDIPNQSIYVNKSVTLDLAKVFSNPDGAHSRTAKLYRKQASQEWIGGSRAKGQVNITGLEPGIVYVTVNAAAVSTASQSTFKVTVINRAPSVKAQISNIRGLSPGGTAKRLDMSYYFTDPDGDTLTYQPTSNKTGVVSVKIIGNALWITPVGSGTAKVTLTATDGHTDKRTVTVSFSVTVNAPPTNLSYELILGEDLQELIIDEYVWVRVNATDPDKKNSRLTYTVESEKGGVVEAEFRTSTRASQYSSNMRIKPISIGTDTLKVTVSDGTSNSTLDIPVKVPETDTNLARAKPDLAILELTASKYTLTPGETFTLDVSVENKGATATSGSKTLFYYLWSSPPTDDDWQDSAHQTSRVKKLTPGAVYEKSIDIKAPTVSGTYYYGVFVFPDTKENNYDNNRSNVIEITVHNPNNRPRKLLAS